MMTIIINQLNGNWAVPGTTYGESILSIYSRNLDHALAEMEIKRRNIQEMQDLLK